MAPGRLQITIPDTSGFISESSFSRTTSPPSWAHSPVPFPSLPDPSPVSPTPDRSMTSSDLSLQSVSSDVDSRIEAPLSPYASFSQHEGSQARSVELVSPNGIASPLDTMRTRSRTGLMSDTVRSLVAQFPPAYPSARSARPASFSSAFRIRRALSVSARPATSPDSATALSTTIHMNTSNASRPGTICTKSTLVRALPGPDPPSMHHSSFYFQDGLVILNVKGSLYRVHRHLLEHNSEYFRELLSQRNSSAGPSGATDDTAISIPDLTPDEFDCLLNFLYYRVYEDSTLSLTQWTTLLDVSTRLRFSTIRALSIRAISAQRSSLSAIETIVLAIKHDVPSWLAPAYAELCRRPHPLGDGEAEHLGAKIAARVGRAREAIRDETFRAYEARYGRKYATPEAFDEELVNTTVSETFWVGDASNPSRS